jgi:hypothetical protein
MPWVIRLLRVQSDMYCWVCRGKGGFSNRSADWWLFADKAQAEKLVEDLGLVESEYIVTYIP